MATSTESVEEQQGSSPPPGEPDDRSTRRLLVIMLWILGIAAVALLALLLFLLWPDSGSPSPGEAEGYPIEVVTTIYGYGEQPDELITTPLGVTFDQSGNVWVSNTGKSRVEVYTSDGSYVRTVGGDPGPGKLATPYGIAIDDARGLAYVADYNGRAVQIFDLEGNYVGHFPSDTQDLAVFGGNGFSPFDVELFEGRVVVSSNDGLYFFDTDGNVIARWGALFKKQPARGSTWGQFDFPDSIVADQANGRLYVTDSLNRRIVALDRDGNWLWTSGIPDQNNELKGFWQLPRGIEIGPDGNLYVVDTFRTDRKGMGTGYVVVLSPEGELLSEFGRMGSEDGAFYFPEQIAAGSDGLWAIADRENNRIVIFRLRTPYPEVTDLHAEEYPQGIARPAEGFVTPAPQPIAASPSP